MTAGARHWLAADQPQHLWEVGSFGEMPDEDGKLILEGLENSAGNYPDTETGIPHLSKIIVPETASPTQTVFSSQWAKCK